MWGQVEAGADWTAVRVYGGSVRLRGDSASV